MRDEVPVGNTDAPSSTMGEAWARFQAAMLERLGVLERLGAELLDVTADPDAVREAEHAARKLHSSLRTFGLNRGSELARDIEALLDAGIPPDPGSTFRYTELVVALRTIIEAGRPPGVRAGVAGGDVDEARVVLIVEEEQEMVEALAAEAMARGWRPEPVSSLASAMSRADRLQGTVAAVIDPRSGGEEELVALLAALHGRVPPGPVVYHATDASQEERLRAVALGVGSFVAKVASPSTILDRIDALVAAGSAVTGTVLIAHQDEEVVRALTSTLERAGHQVLRVQDPLKFWWTLEAVQPDLVLLAADMPGVSGHRLCLAMRADPQWHSLPILFLTARSDIRVVADAFQAGGDDVLVEPVSASDLTARVERRLKRGLAQVRATTQGRTTGRIAPVDLITLQVALAVRHDQVLSVAILGLAAGDPDWVHRGVETLEAAAEPQDVVARIEGGILVSRYGEGSNATRRWLNRVLRAPPGARLRMGIAQYPDLETAHALVESARAELHAAHRAGAAAGAPAPQARADIVVVEDDEAVGSLLTKTLDKRGYQTHWIRDGLEASDLLTGESPPLRATLILLDVGLPGMDGFTLLQRLQRDGITPRTRVMMVTARSSQSEVMRALELGAFDHVAKPFSMSEFLHRVRRAMGSEAQPG